MLDDEKEEKRDVKILGDDADYDYTIEVPNLTREALAKKFPSSIEELKRLAAEAAHVRVNYAPTEKMRKPKTFIKRINCGGHRGTRGLRSR
jgi:hypothetical protein